MFVPRIYYPHPLTVGETITFTKEVSHYLSTVLHLKNKERVILFNGEPGEYSAEFQPQKKIAQAQILSFKPIEHVSTLKLHLGQGLARGDKMDYVIQKATELGVASITALITQNSTVKLDEQRTQKRLAHWQQIAISAAEQCGRTEIPLIQQPILLREWGKQPFTGNSLLFEPHSALSLKKLAPQTNIRIAIGPESGWSEDERQFLLSQNFMPHSLGPRILRTETAGVVALSILQGLYGDFN